MVTRHGSGDRTLAVVERLCRTEPDARALRSAILRELAGATHFRWYVWLLTDPGTGVGADPLAEVPDLARVPEVIRLRYCTGLNRWTAIDDVCSLGLRASESQLWQQEQREAGVVDVASVSFRDQHGIWGMLDLWGLRAYEQDDLDVLRAVRPVVTTALRERRAATFDVVPRLLRPDLASEPAVLVLDDDLRVVSLTAAAEQLLAALLPADAGAPAVPAVAYNVAAQLVAVEAGVDDHPPRARTHVGDGRWLSCRAARLAPGQIAVTMEPATASDRLDVFCRAHGLSARERELLQHLVRGVDSRELGAAMHLSRYTVQDHLTSIFDRTGVRSRRVLLARVLGAGDHSGTGEVTTAT